MRSKGFDPCTLRGRFHHVPDRLGRDSIAPNLPQPADSPEDRPIIKLILGKVDVPIDRTRANSIALFAFKTAVVFDHLVSRRATFFERSARHEFRNSLTIPFNVQMWLTRFVPSGSGFAQTVYHDGKVSPDKTLEMYVCTYSIEHLVLQVVGYKEQGLHQVESKNHFQAITFWPEIQDAFVWPPAEALPTVSDFDSFSARWQNVDVTH